jgi:hypothetical protein
MARRDNIRKALRLGSTKNVLILVAAVGGWLLGDSDVVWKFLGSRRENVRLSIETAIKSKPIREEHWQLIDDLDLLCRDGNRDLRFRAKVNSFNALEQQLAALEGRKAMKYQFECSREQLKLEESLNAEKKR